MKANKLKIKHWINGKLVLSREKDVCGYCDSANVYPQKKANKIFCRACGKESDLE